MAVGIGILFGEGGYLFGKLTSTMLCYMFCHLVQYNRTRRTTALDLVTPQVYIRLNLHIVLSPQMSPDSSLD